MDMNEHLDRLRAALAYDPVTGVFTWRVTRSRTRAGSVAGAPNAGGYLIIRFEKTPHYAHRLAWFFVHGHFPEIDIDHRDGDRQNNRISNLRPCNDQQNQRNRLPTGHGNSNFKGVSWHAKLGKWKAEMRECYLGVFESEEDAARAYDVAALNRDAEFARINFPREDYELVDDVA